MWKSPRTLETQPNSNVDRFLPEVQLSFRGPKYDYNEDCGYYYNMRPSSALHLYGLSALFRPAYEYEAQTTDGLSTTKEWWTKHGKWNEWMNNFFKRFFFNLVFGSFF